MDTTHTTPSGLVFTLPEGLTLRPSGETIQCADCSAWAHLDGLDRIRHSKRCDTRDLQAVRVVAAAAPEAKAAPVPRSSRRPSIYRAAREGTMYLHGYTDDDAIAAGVSGSDAMNQDF
jgi:hypothetical protein